MEEQVWKQGCIDTETKINEMICQFFTLKEYLVLFLWLFQDDVENEEQPL